MSCPVIQELELLVNNKPVTKRVSKSGFVSLIVMFKLILSRYPPGSVLKVKARAVPMCDWKIRSGVSRTVTVRREAPGN